MNFEFPEYTKFPPFYTIQPIAKTREYQLQLWAMLIIKYCEHNHRPVFTFSDFTKLEVFTNKEIHRNLNEDGVKCVFDYMKDQKQVLSLDKKAKFVILYRSIDEWATLVYEYAHSRGLLNHSITFYSMQQDEDSNLLEVDDDLLLTACKVLEKQKRAKILEVNGNFGVVCN
ncbi:vacuolar protein-sorting-associated protein [Entamoeba marina]